MANDKENALWEKMLNVLVDEVIDRLEPLDIVLHCPKCGGQHVDMPQGDWANPPHHTHLCAYCTHLWRPCKLRTNGVAEL